jgi:hypothetical protein
MSLSVAQVCHAADKQDSEKDWCLLGIANKCPSAAPIDPVEKIKRLETALKKGSSVYSPEELNHLHAMLEEVYQIKELLENR